MTNFDRSMAAGYAAAVESPIPIKSFDSWDPLLYRQPRLLVPIDVQALVVAEKGKVERADVSVTTLDHVAGPGRDPATPRSAAPFNVDPEGRVPGVHLHWALPDGLTQTAVLDDDGTMQMHALPNRWLVVRIEQGYTVTTTSWVIESEYAQALALEEWSDGAGKATSPTPDLLPPDVTVTLGGDPAWTAVYDNVVNRFAFHDPLDGMSTTDPMSYLVVGWYSDAQLDPLADASTRPITDILDELGWASEELADRQAEQSSSMTQILDKAGLATFQTTSGFNASTTEGTKLSVPFGAGNVVSDDRLDVDELIISDIPWYPEQSVFHGVVYGVTLNQTKPTDRKPAPGSVRAAIGQTGAESLSALLADNLGGMETAAERLQTGLLYGLAEALDEADGVARLEEEMHRRSYESIHGGTETEWVRRNNVLKGLDPVRPRLPLMDDEGIFYFSFAKGGPETAINQLYAKTKQQKVTDQQRTFDAGLGTAEFGPVERPKPRLFYPQDPVVTLEGLRRSLRHGHDGRFDDEGRLVCRLSGDEQTMLDGMLRGNDRISGGALSHGGVPLEALRLLEEAILADPNGVADTAAFLASQDAKLAGQPVTNRLMAEAVLLTYAGVPDVDFSVFTTESIKSGTVASPVAATYWRQPWIPVYLEWSVDLALEKPCRWRLGEIDYESRAELSDTTVTLTGRSLLSSAAAKSFAQSAADFLADEESREDDGLLDDDAEDLLAALIDEAERSDRLNAALDGLNDHLLGFDTNEAVGERQDGRIEGDHDDPVVTPTRAPRLLRAGHGVLRRLRVVDGFGRFIDLPVTGKVAVSEAMTTEAVSATGVVFELPARITAPARLWFRFIDPAVPTRDARLDQRGIESVSPITAWLLPDHVDRALEVFDEHGDPQGQLRHESLGGGVVWEGAPGLPGNIGQPPLAEDLGQHAAAFVRALVARDAAERSGQATSSDDPETPERESPLSALLRVIDTTLWTVDPFGHIGGEHLSILTGRPIAMVRARVMLDVPSDVEAYPNMDETARAERAAAFAAFAQESFEVRLGALTRTEDGLLGYFLNDDYSQFFPVHGHVLRDARPVGAGQGHLTPWSANPDLAKRPITSPYIVPDPTIDLHPGQNVVLTLLMAPGGKVHATSGILPRKSITLLRDWVKPALERISPSFRFGPVLVDPTTVRMPRIRALPQTQVWTRRDSTVTWRDDPILAATHDALLPDASAMSQEGYIRVSVDEP
ncbi:MAG: hypothetical protein ACFCVC_18255 [Acidimicrobiia bacterium]